LKKKKKHSHDHDLSIKITGCNKYLKSFSLKKK
jgi:hypothetical protein